MKIKPIILLSITLCIWGCSTNKQSDTESSKGYIVDKNGAAIYGTAIEYTRDVYLGRISQGALIELADTIVIKNNHNRPMIKVKVLKDEDYDASEVGFIAWVSLSDTSFVDIYDPESKKLDPWRATLNGLNQTTIDEILKQKRLDEKKESNQSVEPTRKTPVESEKVYVPGAAHA